MKIVITVNTYYPLKDGVQLVTQYHAENLARKGHEVTVITPNYGNREQEFYKGVYIIRTDIVTKHAMYYGDKRAYQNLVLQETKKADAMVNVCTQNPMTDWLFPILDKIVCKKILYMHGMHEQKWNADMLKSAADVGHKIWNNGRWGWYYKTSGKYFKKYNHIVQLHRFDAAFLYFRKHYGMNCQVIENAAEDIFFERAKTEKREKHYAVCVANYIERKNQEFVLRSFYQAKLPASWRMIFIGSEKNHYYERLAGLNQKLADRHGKRDVEFLWGVDRADTIEYMKRADLSLMGSKWEAFPISIVESMAAAVPFITTDVGCVRYLPGGVVVSEESEMAYWLELLAKNSESRCMLGQAGFEYAKSNLSIQSKVNQLEHLLKSEE